MQLKRSHWILLISIVITLTLYNVHFLRHVAYPLILLSTLVHELGHGLTALMVGAHFNSFVMSSDGSGVAAISGEVSNTAHAMIAAGGLLGPSIAALLCFFMSIDPKMSRFALTVLGALLIVADCLYVRSFFGVAFVGALAALFLYLAQQTQAWLAQGTLVFVASQLSLAVFSRADYLFTETAQTTQGPMPSDVGQIALYLFPPYWFWGGIIGFISVIILLLGLWIYIKKS